MTSSSSISSSVMSASEELAAGVFGYFTRAQLMDLIYIAMIISGISAMSSIFIIVTFWKFSRLHTFAYKVIMMLAVANLGFDCAYLVGNVGHAKDLWSMVIRLSWKCNLQGFMRVYFALVEFALVTVITLTCYVIVVKKDFTFRERFATVMAYCWLVPLVMAGLPFTTNNYGDAGAWCSITAKDLKSIEWGTFWRFAVIYVPLWACVTGNAYMYFRVNRAMRGHEAAMAAYVEPEDSQVGGREEEGPVVAGDGGGETAEAESGGRIGPQGIEQSTSMPIIARLQLYPLALVVCWSWATVNRVREAIEPNGADIFWLYILQYSFQTVQGLLNLIIFLRTPGVMEEWRDEVQKIKFSFRRASTVDGSALLSPGPRSDDK